MKRLYAAVYCILFLPALSALPVSGQSGIWNEQKVKTGKAAKNTKGKIKKWKDHLQQWGLDSNYHNGLALGGRLNSNGWSGLLCYQKRAGNSHFHLIQLCFSEIRHEQQIKQERGNIAFPELGAATPFVFGKINNLYTLQFGYGREQLLLPGVMEGHISLGIRMQAGLSLALLKPYYLKLVYVDYGNGGTASVKEEKYAVQNAEKFLRSTDVLGASAWRRGLNEISYVPGGYADAAFVIEAVKHKALIKAITLGVNAAFYTRSLPIMADRKAYPWQGCLYAGLSVGKRWR